jgi:hypothetical protein
MILLTSYMRTMACGVVSSLFECPRRVYIPCEMHDAIAQPNFLRWLLLIFLVRGISSVAESHFGDKYEARDQVLSSPEPCLGSIYRFPAMTPSSQASRKECRTRFVIRAHSVLVLELVAILVSTRQMRGTTGSSVVESRKSARKRLAKNVRIEAWRTDGCDVRGRMTDRKASN